MALGLSWGPDRGLSSCSPHIIPLPRDCRGVGQTEPTCWVEGPGLAPHQIPGGRSVCSQHIAAWMVELRPEDKAGTRLAGQAGTRTGTRPQTELCSEPQNASGSGSRTATLTPSWILGISLDTGCLNSRTTSGGIFLQPHVDAEVFRELDGAPWGRGSLCPQACPGRPHPRSWGPDVGGSGRPPAPGWVGAACWPEWRPPAATYRRGAQSRCKTGS